MYENRKASIRAKAQNSLARIKSISRAAEDENRDLTATEIAQVKTAQKEAEGHLDMLKGIAQDENIMNQAKSIADAVGGDPNGPTAAVGVKGWAATAVQTLRGNMTSKATGQKSLVTGVVNMVNPVVQGIVTEVNVPQTILDLLRNGGEPTGSGPDPYGPHGTGPTQPRQEGTGDLFGSGPGRSNTFSYLRQTVRDNQATVVADGALKPTSTYTFKEIEDRYRVIAHLSEAIPQRFFHDDTQLGNFLASEMAGGLESALEYQVLFGAGPGEDGTGQGMTGILATSGIKIQTFATDQITTSRKALTQLQGAGMAPTAWALNPADAEAFDLLREGATSGQYLLGGPSSAASNALWTIPTALSTAIPAGTALLADWTQGKLLTRQDATLHVDTSGELFTHNQVRFRVEGRFGLAIHRPEAFVKVSLTAGSGE